MTEERYAAWFDDLWRETPGSTVKEKAGWLFEHSTHSEWAILRGEYLRQLNGKQPRQIRPLPHNPRKEVPRPISRPYWTPPDAHRDRAVYDTGIGIRVASYAPDDNDDGWNDDGDADGERWRRHHRRGTEGWAA